MAPKLTKIVICCCFRATGTNVNQFCSKLDALTLTAKFDRHFWWTLFDGVMAP